jgi:pimeloyl-ACP methyl ester carboxylesterase
MNINLTILNLNNEKLDTLIEGNEKSPVTIVMAHGLGTNKHETAGQFDAIAAGLVATYRVVRFDFSGFGKSEGKTEDFDYQKSAQDLNSVLSYVTEIYGGDIYIIAQSMGCFITALLNPKGVKKTILMGIPNSNTAYIIDRLAKRISSRLGGVVNFDGLSTVPRTSGAIQTFGSSFWKVLKEFDPIQSIGNLAKNTELLIIHPIQDEVVGPEYQKEYDAIPNVKIEWLNGNHAFSNPKDRQALIEKIKQFFS